MYYYFVEEKIKKAIDNGDFDDLPGMGEPLDYSDDLPGLSPELKMGYRMLKNAGYLSEQKNKKNSAITFEDLLNTATEGLDKGDYQKRIEFDELVVDRKLRSNSKFIEYTNKIYNKLFN
ncbi:DnaJ family domain-containing protein [Niallia oryzisoli]|uniref:DnaJ family domain-containing protein n=1 Tax=Niallia oryzisoli TaxID=1737571 RepID=UPI00373610B6